MSIKKTILYRRLAARIGSAVAAASLSAACQSPAPDAVATSRAPKTIVANGYSVPYIDQGRGEPVVFVHGALSDYRTWDRQRAALSGYRTIAYTQRYFGVQPWGADWPKFNQQTHADDLAALIRALNVGPVHLVAWSYSGHIALAVAVQHPELVKSAFVFEPSAPTSYVTGAAERKAIGDDAAAFGPVGKAVQAGDNVQAVRQLIDMVGERPGYFDAQPADIRAIQLDSARSMQVLSGHETKPDISCQQLERLRAPVAIVRGSDSRPFFRLIADAAMRCLQGHRRASSRRRSAKRSPRSSRVRSVDEARELTRPPACSRASLRPRAPRGSMFADNASNSSPRGPEGATAGAALP